MGFLSGLVSHVWSIFDFQPSGPTIGHTMVRDKCREVLSYFQCRNGSRHWNAAGKGCCL